MHIYDEVSELQYFYSTFAEIPLFKIKKNKIGLKFRLLQNILQMSLNELSRVCFVYHRQKGSSPKQAGLQELRHAQCLAPRPLLAFWRCDLATNRSKRVSPLLVEAALLISFKHTSDSFQTNVRSIAKIYIQII